MHNSNSKISFVGVQAAENRLRNAIPKYTGSPTEDGDSMFI